MRDPHGELTKEAIQKHADLHYLSHDRGMSVWICHQVALVEVSGIWTRSTTKEHLDELFNDFAYIRRQWTKVYAIIDCSHFEMQSVTFRSVVNNYWVKFFNRSDLMICFVENNALRRSIRSAILTLIPKSDNIYLRKNYGEISDLILPLIRAEEEERSGYKKEIGVRSGNGSNTIQGKAPGERT